MQIIEAVRHFFHGKRYADLDQDETEAFVDALCYAIAADGQIDTVERDRLAEELDDIDWNGEQSVDMFIDDALARAAERVERGEDPELYARSIRDRITSQDLQEDIYLFAAQIAAADNELAQNEQELLAELVDEFDIPQETVEDVTGWIIFESDLQHADSIPADSPSGDDRLREQTTSDRTPNNSDTGSDGAPDSQSDW
jgi:uncharacterized membrane protein YebE (DUF533 family)